MQRTNLELESIKEKIKENQEKIKLNKQLPYLVGNIVEVCLLTCYALKLILFLSKLIVHAFRIFLVGNPSLLFYVRVRDSDFVHEVKSMSLRFPKAGELQLFKCLYKIHRIKNKISVV